MIYGLRVNQASVGSRFQQESIRGGWQEFLFVCNNPKSGGDKDGIEELGCGAVEAGGKIQRGEEFKYEEH